MHIYIYAHSEIHISSMHILFIQVYLKNYKTSLLKTFFYILNYFSAPSEIFNINWWLSKYFWFSQTIIKAVLLIMLWLYLCSGFLFYVSFILFKYRIFFWCQFCKLLHIYIVLCNVLVMKYLICFFQNLIKYHWFRVVWFYVQYF